MSYTKGQPGLNGEGDRGLIYVVDDEPMLLELASVILQPVGFRIKTFRDPDAAAEAFAKEDPPPVLLITDYSMHVMNGLDLICECRRTQPRQKILLISGTVDERIYRGATQKPNRFLAKPYTSRDLILAVESLLAE